MAAKRVGNELRQHFPKENVESNGQPVIEQKQNTDESKVKISSKQLICDKTIELKSHAIGMSGQKC